MLSYPTTLPNDAVEVLINAIFNPSSLKDPAEKQKLVLALYNLEGFLLHSTIGSPPDANNMVGAVDWRLALKILLQTIAASLDKVVTDAPPPAVGP